jgi:hypothetical protein
VGSGITGIRSHLGTYFPWIEPKPPLVPITEAGGEDASPAEQAAAEAKAEEDKAAQKVKAIKFLTSRGCGKCYPDTEKALISALEDCIEVVRYETVKGLYRNLGKGCGCCRENSCCTVKLLEKLYELAYERDLRGCYLEPSPRVRRYARLLMEKCGPPVPEELEAEEPTPEEGPTEEGDEPEGEQAADEDSKENATVQKKDDDSTAGGDTGDKEDSSSGDMLASETNDPELNSAGSDDSTPAGDAPPKNDKSSLPKPDSELLPPPIPDGADAGAGETELPTGLRAPASANRKPVGSGIGTADQPE